MTPHRPSCTHPPVPAHTQAHLAAAKMVTEGSLPALVADHLVINLGTQNNTDLINAATQVRPSAWLHMINLAVSSKTRMHVTTTCTKGCECCTKLLLRPAPFVAHPLVRRVCAPLPPAAAHAAWGQRRRTM